MVSSLTLSGKLLRPSIMFTPFLIEVEVAVKNNFNSYESCHPNERLVILCRCLYTPSIKISKERNKVNK